jgi:hypothetical protein
MFKKMDNFRTLSTNVKKSATIALILLLSLSASATYLQNVNAATVNYNKQSYAFIGVRDNPVGVGQSDLIVMWLDLPPPWDTILPSNEQNWNYVYYTGLTLTITKPDGTNENVSIRNSDSTGSSYTTYTPATVGTYYFQFSYAGQTYDFNYNNVTYHFVMSPATSEKIAVKVQEEAIQTWPETPVPTNYWTQPINGMNRNWATIAGDWVEPNYDAQGTKFNPYGAAPSSGHVMWTKPIWAGGIAGGNTGNREYFYGVTYEPRWYGFVENGVLFYNDLTNPRYGWYAINLHTGEELYWTNSSLPSISAGVTLASIYWPALSFGQELNVETPNEHGVFPYTWSTNGTTWQMYDATSGKYICQIINVPSGTRYGQDQNGNEIIYVLKAPTATTAGWIAQWNSTTAIGSSPFFFVWRPQPGATYNGVNGYDWNVTLSPGSLPSTAAIARVLAGTGWPTAVDPVEIVGTAGGLNPVNPLSAAQTGNPSLATTASGTKDPWNVWALKIDQTVPSKVSVAFNTNYTAPTGNITLSFGNMDPSAGVWTVFSKETIQYSGYSLADGHLLWTTQAQPAWDMYGPTGLVAYGRMYTAGYAGTVFCYDVSTGKLLWNYTAPNIGQESPYGNYPLTVCAAAGGMIYTLSSEHSPSNPQWRGSYIRCINVTTGNEIWKEECWAQSGTIITNGYLVTLNAYDDQIYTFGKGPSKMTVVAPNVGVTTSTPITITGTIMDICAGSEQDAVKANFPNGLPCVSDASESQFMEAVYQQQVMPTNITGVPIEISVVDANNNYRLIGTATSDPNGNYAFTWTPDIPGNFYAIANFAGSNSYFGSSASTTFHASDAATPAPTQQTQTSLATTNDIMTYMTVGVAAIIIAIAIIGALVLITIRKRP